MFAVGYSLALWEGIFEELEEDIGVDVIVFHCIHSGIYQKKKNLKIVLSLFTRI